MNETEFIDALRALPLHPGARGLADDAAILEIGGETLVLTHDSMAEGTHFRAEADMADVAWKLVATNLSDLAAKGAEPVGVLLGHSLGRGDEAFLSGLEEVLKAFQTPLMGGDTVRADGPRTFGLTAIGRATHTPVPARSGASPGDAVYVTGIIGRAMLGFEGHPDHVDAYGRPNPLLGEGRKLAPVVSAMMDVSDGLLLDCWRMAWASDCTFEIDTASVPVADPGRREECLRWGDDYQLLFTAPEKVELPVKATRIGTVCARTSAPLTVDGVPMPDADGLGYTHG